MSWFSLETLLLAVLILVFLSGCSSRPPSPPPLLTDSEWRSIDGKVMPCTAWIPPTTQRPKAVVIAIHGLSGAKSDFWLLGERLAATGIAVHAYDLRGQGNDPVVKARGDIPSAKTWLRDLHTFDRLIRQRYPATPVFWYGESLGSLIALHAAVAPQQQRPHGLLLASPAAGLRHPISSGKRALLNLARVVVPTKRLHLGDLAGIDESAIQVTSTTTHGTQMTQTPHHVESFSLRLLVAIGHLVDRSPTAAAACSEPLLMLASPHDVVAAPEQITRLFDQCRATVKQLHWYERSHHLLLHDLERETVARDVIRWLNVQLVPTR
jgi:acylglycerol lipase